MEGLDSVGFGVIFGQGARICMWCGEVQKLPFLHQLSAFGVGLVIVGAAVGDVSELAEAGGDVFQDGCRTGRMEVDQGGRPGTQRCRQQPQVLIS